MPATRKQEKPTPPVDPWMTLYGAARLVGESRLSILTRIVKGELVGQHLGGQTFVRRDTVERLIESRSTSR